MAVKYRIQYTDVTNVDYECTFENDNYTGEEIILDGRCSVRSARVLDFYVPVRGKQLDIIVTASIEEPLSDLWQDDEYYWFVKFTRDSKVKFIGYLSSEGVFEDYNNPVWELSLTAIGPLGIINDLAYVTPEGAPYVGLEKTIVIISNALKRAFSQASHYMPINCYLDFSGEGQPTGISDQFVTYAHLDQSLYIRNDGESIQSSMDVVKEIMTSLNCMIFQENGEFYICNPDILATNNSLEFKNYNSSGVYNTTITKSGLTKTIGDQEELIHCSENQQISNERSVDTFVLRHDFEYNEELLTNPDLEHDNVTLEGWTVVAPWAVLVTDQGVDISSESINSSGAGNPGSIALRSDYIRVIKNESFKLILDLDYTDVPQQHGVFIELKLPGAPNINIAYTYMKGAWRSAADVVFFTDTYLAPPDEDGVIRYEVDIPSLPIDGELRIGIRQPRVFIDNFTASSGVIVTKCSLISVSGILAGKEVLFKKLAPKKEKVKDPQNVRFDTDDNDSIKNLFLKSDGTRITNINSGTFLNNYSLLAYVAYKRGIAKQSKQIVFSGNVYGYVPILSNLDYVGISGNMHILEHIWDTEANITYIKAINLETGDDKTFDGTLTERIVFRETIKPTIES